MESGILVWNLKSLIEFREISNLTRDFNLVSGPSKVSAGNSGQLVIPDTQNILVTNITFGLKIHMLRHLPHRHLQTENEVNA